MIRSLLVDDNAINLEIQKMVLESCGLIVSTANSGMEAIRMADAEEFSIIFMDVHMPEMDGYEAARNIKAKHPSVQIFALTAEAVSEIGEKPQQNGMNGYISKPLQMQKVRELLQNVAIVQPQVQTVSPDCLIDYDKLLTVFNDTAIVEKLLKQFLSTHSGDCDELKQCIISRNFWGAREILHNIVGISGNLFCIKLYRIALQLQKELKQERSDSLSDFLEIWDSTIQELQFLTSSSNETASPQKSDNDFCKLQNTFLEICSSFDISAVDFFVKHRAIFSENMEKAAFAQLENAVLNYNFLWIVENMEA